MTRQVPEDVFPFAEWAADQQNDFLPLLARLQTWIELPEAMYEAGYVIGLWGRITRHRLELLRPSFLIDPETCEHLPVASVLRTALENLSALGLVEWNRVGDQVFVRATRNNVINQVRQDVARGKEIESDRGIIVD